MLGREAKLFGGAVERSRDANPTADLSFDYEFVLGFDDAFFDDEDFRIAGHTAR